MPSISGLPVAGKQGRVTVGGLILNLNKWSFNADAKDLETTNFESTGPDNELYEQGIMGKRYADVNFEGFWDASIPPHGPIPNLVAGAILANVNLYVDKSISSRCYQMSSFRVMKVEANNNVQELAGVKVSGKTNGYYIMSS